MPPTPPTPATNGLAIAGFILGLLGFLGCFIPILNIGAIVLAVIGIILAAIGLIASKTKGSGKGLALAGLILGVLAVIIGIVMNAAVFKAASDATQTNVTTPTTSVAFAPASQAVTGASSSASADGSSREHPAALDSVITSADWSVVINSVTTTDKDSFSQPPAAGNVLLVVNLTATYNGDDPQGSTWFGTVNYVTPGGNTITGLDGSTFFIPDDQFPSSQTVFHGASLTGNEMIEVPADNWQQGVLSVTPDLFADAVFVAVQ